jgi:hypothetical protein
MRMKHTILVAAVALALVPGAAGAQVTSIELEIAGYLCGF